MIFSHIKVFLESILLSSADLKHHIYEIYSFSCVALYAFKHADGFCFVFYTPGSHFRDSLILEASS